MSVGISLGALVYFRSLNQINHAARPVAPILSDFITAEFYLNLLTWGFNNLGYLLPVIAALIISHRNRQMETAIIWCAILLIFRCVLNQCIYQRVRGTFWANSGTLVAIHLLLLLAFTHTNQARFRKLIPVAIIASTMLGFAGSMHSTAFKYMMAVVRNQLPTRPWISECQTIADMGAKSPALGYVICPEFMMASFMNQSHVAEPWVTSRPTGEQDHLLKNANQIILRKDSDLLRFVRDQPHDYDLIYEGELLISYKPAKPAR